MEVDGLLTTTFSFQRDIEHVPVKDAVGVTLDWMVSWTGKYGDDVETKRCALPVPTFIEPLVDPETTITV